MATLLGYGEPQIPEVFKNTLSLKLYWVLFPIEDLRQAVETAKRILTKEKLDRQLTGQTSTSPFMNIRDGTDKRVSFNTRDELGDKIDKLTVMVSKLAAKDSHENVFELEGVINSKDCRFEFLNRSVPIYPEKEIILKTDLKKVVKVKAPFVDEILVLVTIKIIDGKTSSTLSIKLKFTCNKAILDIRNAGKDTMILNPREMIGIVDIRSLGYYKIKQGILQQNLSKYYKFEEAGRLCEYFNKFVNTLKEDREQVSLVDKYPW